MLRHPENRDTLYAFGAGEEAVKQLRDGGVQEFLVKPGEEANIEFWAGVKAALAEEVSYAKGEQALAIAGAVSNVDEVILSLKNQPDARVDVRPAVDTITKAFSTVH